MIQNQMKLQIVAFVLLAAHAGAQAPAANAATAGATAKVTDPQENSDWCSLPRASKQEFLQRQRLPKATQANAGSISTPRTREDSAVEKLRRLKLQMEGGQAPSDAILKGHLQIVSKTGLVSVPVTYELTYDGKERVTTQFSAGNSTFVADGKLAGIFMGNRPLPISPVTQEDHQIQVLPQWSRLAMHSDARFGVKEFPGIDGLTVIEVLPPERADPGVQRILPSTATCIAIDSGTQTVSRIEKIELAQNRLTRMHRISLVYSNYQSIQGIAVPLTQIRYLDGVEQDELTIDSASFNNGLSAKEFTWSGN